MGLESTRSCETFPCMLERRGRFGGPPSLFRPPGIGMPLDKRDCLPSIRAAALLPDALLLSCDGLIVLRVERLMASSSSLGFRNSSGNKRRMKDAMLNPKNSSASFSFLKPDGHDTLFWSLSTTVSLLLSHPVAPHHTYRWRRNPQSPRAIETSKFGSHEGSVQQISRPSLRLLKTPASTELQELRTGYKMCAKQRHGGLKYVTLAQLGQMSKKYQTLRP